MAAKKIEQKRLLDYLTTYLESSEPVSIDPTQATTTMQTAETADKNAQIQAKTAEKTAKAAAATRSSVANKTIQSRKTIHGPKTVSKPALKKLKGK